MCGFAWLSSPSKAGLSASADGMAEGADVCFSLGAIKTRWSATGPKTDACVSLPLWAAVALANLDEAKFWGDASPLWFMTAETAAIWPRETCPDANA